MKARNIIVTATLIEIFLLSISIVCASELPKGFDEIESGYAVTTNYHGIEVPPDATVTAIAGTTNKDIVEEVIFKWKDPNGNVLYQCSNSSPLVEATFTTKKGEPIYITTCEYTLPGNIIGDCSVQVFFIGQGGKTRQSIEEVIAIRATSFNVVPDLPVVGVAGALTVMLLSLHLYTKKKLIKLK